MIPMIIAMVASTAATVGATIATTIEQKKQADKGAKQQKEFTLAAAYVDYGTALNAAPGAVPT